MPTREQRKRAEFRKRFPRTAASGQVRFAPKPPTAPGYRITFSKAPQYMLTKKETVWGFRRTGRELLLIISPR